MVSSKAKLLKNNLFNGLLGGRELEHGLSEKEALTLPRVDFEKALEQPAPDLPLQLIIDEVATIVRTPEGQGTDLLSFCKLVPGRDLAPFRLSSAVGEDTGTIFREKSEERRPCMGSRWPHCRGAASPPKPALMMPLPLSMQTI